MLLRGPPLALAPAGAGAPPDDDDGAAEAEASELVADAESDAAGAGAGASPAVAVPGVATGEASAVLAGVALGAVTVEGDPLPLATEDASPAPPLPPLAPDADVATLLVLLPMPRLAAIDLRWWTVDLAGAGGALGAPPLAGTAVDVTTSGAGGGGGGRSCAASGTLDGTRATVRTVSEGAL